MSLDEFCTNNLEKVFTNIYENHTWSGETRSGPGSAIWITQFLRRILPHIMETYMRSPVFLDAPCGDWNWMKEVEIPRWVKYIGIDIVPSLIEYNRVQYGRSGVSFLCGDITEMDLPEADMILARHFFQHLSPLNVRKAVQNFKSAGKYLLATTYERALDGIKTDKVLDGGFYPYNMSLILGQPLALFPAINNTYPEERLGLWLLNP